MLAFNQDGTLNSASNAAAAGSVVVLYATGLGQTSPPQLDGVRESSLVLAETVIPVNVTIGGMPAQVIYAGSAPGQIAGVMQVEAVVPAGAGTGRRGSGRREARYATRPRRLRPSGSHRPAQPRHVRAGCASASRCRGRGDVPGSRHDRFRPAFSTFAFVLPILAVLL